MLPHVDAAVLSSNPSFARLHRDLTTTKLNADGSSKVQDTRLVGERDTFVKELRYARVALAREKIINESLRRIAQDESRLPEDLRDIVQIVLAQLERRLDTADHDAADIATAAFMANIGHIVPLLSDHIEASLSTLDSVLDPSIQQPLNQNATDLPTRIAALQSSIEAQKSQLDVANINLTQEASSVIVLHSTVIETVIRILESSMHGSVARYTRARAECLSLRAEEAEKKLILMDGQARRNFLTEDVEGMLASSTRRIEEENDAWRREVSWLERRLHEAQNHDRRH